MKLTDLINFFAGLISPSKFVGAISDEVDTYKKASEKIGSSMDVVFEDNGGILEIGAPELSVLCKAFLTTELNQWDVCYICDALLMSEYVNFKNDGIRNAIEEMTDPDINGELTEARVRDVLETVLGL
jgi:phospholipid N-methyltransferase